MASTLSAGVRKLPSAIDLEVLHTVWATPGGYAVSSSPDQLYVGPDDGGSGDGSGTTGGVSGTPSAPPAPTDPPRPAPSWPLVRPGDPLPTGIINGDFAVADAGDPRFGWTVRGAGSVAGGAALLTKDGRRFTDFSQAFLLPAGATFLQFTIARSQLAADPTPSRPPCSTRPPAVRCWARSPA
jgi:hypothetical protein